jgi:ABC-2 type transport system permease protein
VRALWPLGAIFARDLKIACSYRLNAALSVGSTLFGVTLWYFFSRSVSPNQPGWAQGGYFGYLVTGTALMGFVNVALHTFGRKLRQDQITGTLEVFLGSPAPPYLILFASLLWDLFTQVLQVAATILASLLFGLHLHLGSLSALTLLMLLTILVFAALGLSAAALLLVFQRGEPVTPFVGAFFALMGGVFFPPSILPPALASLSKVLPLPYALEGLRGLMLEGWTFAQALPDLVALAIFAAVLMPISLVVFPLCLAFARRHGLLSTY